MEICNRDRSRGNIFIVRAPLKAGFGETRVGKSSQGGVLAYHPCDAGKPTRSRRVPLFFFGSVEIRNSHSLATTIRRVRIAWEVEMYDR